MHSRNSWTILTYLRKMKNLWDVKSSQLAILYQLETTMAWLLHILKVMMKLVIVFHRFGRVHITLVPKMITEDVCVDTSPLIQIMSALTVLKRQPSSQKKIKRKSMKKISLNKMKISLTKRIQMKSSLRMRIKKKSTRKTKRTKLHRSEWLTQQLSLLKSGQIVTMMMLNHRKLFIKLTGPSILFKKNLFRCIQFCTTTATLSDISLWFLLK